MSAPQTKERPASMLRAMFAGFGSLMSKKDKTRSKPAAEAPAATTTAAPEDTAAPEETVTPADTAAEAVPAETVAAETVAEPEPPTAPEAVTEPETPAAPETVAAETTPEPETSAVPEESSALPLANYDDLSVASLRARLRNLTNDDLTQLMTYEMAHQNRPEVVKMFQNRLIKMTSGLPKLVE
jgi:hypothetical protein